MFKHHSRSHRKRSYWMRCQPVSEFMKFSSYYFLKRLQRPPWRFSKAKTQFGFVREKELNMVHLVMVVFSILKGSARICGRKDQFGFLDRLRVCCGNWHVFDDETIKQTSSYCSAGAIEYRTMKSNVLRICNIISIYCYCVLIRSI